MNKVHSVQSERGNGIFYGTGIPGPLARHTPWGRAAMRRILRAHLTVASEHGASEDMIADLRTELRHYSGPVPHWPLRS